MEKGSNYRDFFFFIYIFLSTFCLFWLVMPASLFFSFCWLHLCCLLGHVGQIPSHCLLSEVSANKRVTASNDKFKYTQLQPAPAPASSTVYCEFKRHVGHTVGEPQKVLAPVWGARKLSPTNAYVSILTHFDIFMAVESFTLC